MSSPETTHQQLITAAWRVISDATHYRLDDGRLAVSPARIAALKTALAAYETLLRLASAQIIISDGTMILLDACLRLPLAQARRLARRFIAACQGQTAPKKNSPEVIFFNRVSGPYGFLSNFARYPIRLNGYIWPTVEHYYQAQKFAGTEQEHLIRLAGGSGRGDAPGAPG